MNLDAILEVAIGLVLAWLILGAAASQIQEWMNNALQTRAAFLEKGILNIFGDQPLVDSFYKHPLIQTLSENVKKHQEPFLRRLVGRFSKQPVDQTSVEQNQRARKPSYIPAGKFAQAALDVLVSGEKNIIAASGLSKSEITARVDQFKKAGSSKAADLVDHVFPNLSNEALSVEHVIAITRANLEEQFKDSMERVQGWFKRYMQKWSLAIGLVLALALNVDTVQIATQLWNQPTERAFLVAQAQTAGPGSTILQLNQQIQNLNLPIGWTTKQVDCQAIGFMPGQSKPPGLPGFGGKCQEIANLPALNDLWGWLEKLFGILISGIAASQGAPFWFNALGKLIGLRSSGIIPASSPPTVQAAQPTDSPPSTSQPAGQQTSLQSTPPPSQGITAPSSTSSSGTAP